MKNKFLPIQDLNNRKLISKTIDAIKHACPDELIDDQDYISIEHFLAVQSINNVMLFNKSYIEGKILNNGGIYLFIYNLPLDNYDNEDYILNTSNYITDLMRLSPDFDNITIDYTNNVGGVILDFVDSLIYVLHLLVDVRKNIDLAKLYSKSGKEEGRFYLENGLFHLEYYDSITYKNNIGINEEMLKILDKKRGKVKINIILNEKSGSSAEICPLIFESFGAKLYGQVANIKSYGLINSMKRIDGNNSNILIPCYNFKIGGKLYKSDLDNYSFIELKKKYTNDMVN